MGMMYAGSSYAWTSTISEPNTFARLSEYRSAFSAEGEKSTGHRMILKSAMSVICTPPGALPAARLGTVIRVHGQAVQLARAVRVHGAALKTAFGRSRGWGDS